MVILTIAALAICPHAIDPESSEMELLIMWSQEPSKAVQIPIHVSRCSFIDTYLQRRLLYVKKQNEGSSEIKKR